MDDQGTRRRGVKPKIWASLRYFSVAVLGFVVGAGVVSQQATKDRTQRFVAENALWRASATSFQAETLTGETWRLTDHKGKIVLLEFWATWCPGCSATMQRFKALHDEFGKRDDFSMLGISLDKQPQTAKLFCEQEGLTWPQTVEPNANWNNSIARAYAVSAIPCIRIIDRDGIIRVIDGDTVDIRWVIKELLDNPSASGYTKSRP